MNMLCVCVAYMCSVFVLCACVLCFCGSFVARFSVVSSGCMIVSIVAVVYLYRVFVSYVVSCVCVAHMCRLFV